MIEHIARKLLSNEVILNAYFNKNEIEKIILEKNIYFKNKKEINKFSYNALITEKSNIITFSKSWQNKDIYLEMMDGISLKEIWDNPTSFYFVQDFVNDFKHGNLKQPINLTAYTDILNKDSLRIYNFVKDISEDEYNINIIKQKKLFTKIVNKITKSR